LATKWDNHFVFLRVHLKGCRSSHIKGKTIKKADIEFYAVFFGKSDEFCLCPNLETYMHAILLYIYIFKPCYLLFS